MTNQTQTQTTLQSETLLAQLQAQLQALQSAVLKPNTSKPSVRSKWSDQRANESFDSWQLRLATRRDKDVRRITAKRQAQRKSDEAQLVKLLTKSNEHTEATLTVLSATDQLDTVSTIVKSLKDDEVATLAKLSKPFTSIPDRVRPYSFPQGKVRKPKGFTDGEFSKQVLEALATFARWASTNPRKFIAKRCSLPVVLFDPNVRPFNTTSHKETLTDSFFVVSGFADGPYSQLPRLPVSFVQAQILSGLGFMDHNVYRVADRPLTQAQLEAQLPKPQAPFVPCERSLVTLRSMNPVRGFNPCADTTSTVKPRYIGEFSLWPKSYRTSER